MTNLNPCAVETQTHLIGLFAHARIRNSLMGPREGFKSAEVLGRGGICGNRNTLKQGAAAGFGGDLVKTTHRLFMHELEVESGPERITHELEKVFVPPPLCH